MLSGEFQKEIGKEPLEQLELNTHNHPVLQELRYSVLRRVSHACRAKLDVKKEATFLLSSL